jgi:hypothetical protein
MEMKQHMLIMAQQANLDEIIIENMQDQVKALKSDRDALIELKIVPLDELRDSLDLTKKEKKAAEDKIKEIEIEEAIIIHNLADVKIELSKIVLRHI